jgi:predicted  nucleic acid-binding Zn-ribbon protein
MTCLPELLLQNEPNTIMAETAKNLGELHALHQRARAIRDRLESGPKTLATRRRVLDVRKADLEKAQKALKDAKAHNLTLESRLKSVEAKIDDLRTKLNQARKQADFDAIRNQIAHENASKAKIEDEVLQFLEGLEQQGSQLAAQEQDVKSLEAEVNEMAAALEQAAGPQKAQLAELDAALVASESILPADQRDQYRRVVKQRASDAMAALEEGACTGCFVAVTAQMMNDLINGGVLSFCRTCGRVLYIPEADEPQTRRREA